MFFPARVPCLRRALAEARVDVLYLVDAEIVIQSTGLPVIDHAALVEHQDRIVEIEIRQTMGHIDDNAVMLAAQGMHQAHDFLLTFRI